MGTKFKYDLKDTGIVIYVLIATAVLFLLDATGIVSIDTLYIFLPLIILGMILGILIVLIMVYAIFSYLFSNKR